MNERDNNFEGNINRIVRIQFEKLQFRCPYDDECTFNDST